MDENQILPKNEGVEHKVITNSVLNQCICKTVYPWKIKYCFCEW